MAANTRARASAYGMNAPVSSTELQTIQVQAAQSVNRTNTSTGWSQIPLCTCGSLEGVNHFHGNDFDDVSTASDYPLVYFDITGLPDGHQFDGLRIKLRPALGHADVPGTMPSCAVFRTNYTTFVTSTLGIGGCASITDKAVYEAGVTLSTSFAPVTVDRENERYWGYLEGEYGDNKVTGLEYVGMQAHVIIDDTEGGPDFKFW